MKLTPPHIYDSYAKNSKSLKNIDLNGIFETKICDFKLSIRRSFVNNNIHKLQKELNNAGLIHLKPKFYLGDEWFSPNDSIAISIPFYLAHYRLRSIEKKLMGFIEGGDDINCMKLLRHEAGHCFDNAYGLSKSSSWKKIFGSPNLKYDTEN